MLALLESEEPGSLLARALGSLGWDLVGWQRTAVHHRPGAGVTGVFSIDLVPRRERRRDRTGDRAPDDTVGTAPTHACITSCTVPQPAGRVVVLHRGGADTLSVWVHPFDPLLPGLPMALERQRVTPFAFGSGRPRGATVLELTGYRPLRRAVVLARNDGDCRYLKVLRRGAGAPMAERHRMLRVAGIPAPLLTGEPVDDVVAMHPAKGTPLAELLMRDGASDVDPHALVRLLMSLPDAVLRLPERPPWAARVLDYGEGAAAALPGMTDRIRRLATDIGDTVRGSEDGPRVPTHGDFYEGNLLIADGTVSGLLDVDALGPGRLVDDLACFLGHIAVLPGLHSGYLHVPWALRRFAEAFDQHVDPVALRSRAAAVSLTLIAGARRRTGNSGSSAEALSRLEVAERFLAEARAINAQR